MGLQFPRFPLPFPNPAVAVDPDAPDPARIRHQFPGSPLIIGVPFPAWQGYSWSDLNYSSYSLRPIEYQRDRVWGMSIGRISWIISRTNISSEVTSRSSSAAFRSVMSITISASIWAETTLLRFNYEMAGNLLDGLMHLFSRPAAGRTITRFSIFQYSQYFRADLSVSRKIMLGEVTALVGRLYGGYGMAYGNSTSIPFDRLILCGRCQQHARLGTPYVGAGAVPEPEDASFPYTTGRYEAGGQSRIALPDLGMFHGRRSSMWAISGLPTGIPRLRPLRFSISRQFPQATGLRCRYRSAPGHQICRTASGLGHTDPQPQCTCRTTVDPQFQVEEYGA